ncbi:unnamed protein product, partial [Rotaria sp. Silwood1]
MFKKYSFLLFLLLLSWFNTSTCRVIIQKQKRIVCYYLNWAQHRPEGGNFFPENLDTSLCTHIIYAFAILKNSKLAPSEWNNLQNELNMYSRLMELKKTNDIKILLAIAGWNFDSGDIFDVIKNKQLRKEFVQQSTQFLRDYQFDGLDLHCEYPDNRLRNKQLFTTLTKELHIAFQPYYLLLTATVGAAKSIIEADYEIDKISQYLDFVNLMPYDLQAGSWKNTTSLHTPLYANPQDKKQIIFNQNWTINYWIQHGMSKEKINMGLILYGRTFKLFNSSNADIGAPTLEPGEPGKYTREKGLLSYYEICEKFNNDQWIHKYDDVQKSMYAYNEKMWIGYNNIHTLTIRVNYINEKGLGGVAIWAPDFDDFSGKFCNRGPYPLINTVVNLIRSSTTTSSSSPSITVELLKTIKKNNQKIKIIYSIFGLWQSEYSTLLTHIEQREQFNEQIYQFLLNNKFDGFDIDFNIQDNKISLMNKYYLSIWLSELKNILISNKLLLSIGISGKKLVLDYSYDFIRIANTIDFIRLMAFDQTSKTVTNLINPLYSVTDDDQYNDINWAINYVQKLGIPPEKISLGLPTYGRRYTLVNGHENTIKSPIIGSSMILSYSDICKLIETDEYIKVYNNKSYSSYAFNSNTKLWISYNTINDVALK